MSDDPIVIKNAHQNNLKNLNLTLPAGELIVITGVSGSGKSSLAFDTLYAEGQRRYVETFSPYARQFLDRMDKPQVERISGIPPAIAIDQTNPVRTSRSTVGTMTELNDHIKLLYARAASLYCSGCAKPVVRDSPESIYSALLERGAQCDSERAMICFSIQVPENFSETEVLDLLAQQGYTRVHQHQGSTLIVIQDRLRIDAKNRARGVEALEAALKSGRGEISVYPLDAQKNALAPWLFSSALHCPDCKLHYQDATPSLFSFNSPIGACPSCRGFGRVVGVDFTLVVPDENKTLAEGAVKPWQTPSNKECQNDLMRYAKKAGIPTDKPWRRLSKKQQQWVLQGEGDLDDGLWYGVQRFFDWLESKSYKMHIRVLLSKYRSYTPCTVCKGARLKHTALLWRLGTRAQAQAVLADQQRFMPAGVTYTEQTLQTLPGLLLHDVMLLPLDRCRLFFDNLQLPAPLDKASDLLLNEIRSRLRYLVEVGLAYLSLDRQSRTLSGGEVQRINLTTALGTSLVNTLFVLDEPSIGLHARDMQRVIDVLHRLRDAGNSLVVVEHDPQIMMAADRILDIGPGPGEHGGKKMFFGSPEALLQSKRSLTARYLNGEKTVVDKHTAVAPANDTAPTYLQIFGASEHNLKNIDVHIPLKRLVCLTGVSGSGKSTLVQDILYNALRKSLGKPAQMPGAHRALKGQEQLDDVVLVDQSPIGRTTRSNPASYVGAWNAIRQRFAGEPLAQARGYTAGTFSFNSGNGRCPVCSGSGYEHVEMQFLSDVYLRCPECDGKRYRKEIQEITLAAPLPENTQKAATKKQPIARARSIADVLEMTVTEALHFFCAHRDVQHALEPLKAVGLGYLKLGQPVPTLSGGEAQRLKLAGYLAKAGGGKNTLAPTLFLFDEPTTGLHFDDIAKLMIAFRRLLQDGHSLLIIEHNLDVIRSADWIIELGPQGGDAGGELIGAGDVKTLSALRDSHTATALRAYERALRAQAKSGHGLIAKPKKAKSSVSRKAKKDCIEIINAREHNLKNINISIPRGRFTVITGVSGSGKSTVAFDILFAEGQRRYLESLNAYARQFVQPASRPDIDALYGIPPTVAIEQRSSRGGHKSTVATLTETYHFLRLLFVKLGTQHCPDCHTPIDQQSPEALHARIMRDYRGKTITLLAPLINARKGYYTELAQWAQNKGFDSLRVDGVMHPTQDWPRLDRFKEHSIELPIATLKITPAQENPLSQFVQQALDYGKGVLHVLEQNTGAGRKKLTPQIFSTLRACTCCGRGFEELDPRLFSYNSKHGWCPQCFGTGLRIQGFDEEQSGEENQWLEEQNENDTTCTRCAGQRLNPEALAVTYRKRSIAQFAALSVEQAEKIFRELKPRGREALITRDILAELRARLRFLKDVGLSYLSLERAAPTLSGGEAQRIRLAAQLGSNLQGVCYILDEPTIGLHPRDNNMLLKTLSRLEGKGNTVVVVEHDEDTIRRAEHIIDFGPSAGVRGGRVVAQGTLNDIIRAKQSQTGRFLAKPLRHPLFERRPVTMKGKNKTPQLEMLGVKRHNLNTLNARLPLQRLVVVSGVSGSGKSTLIRQVLLKNLQLLLSKKSKKAQNKTALHCRRFEGWQQIQRVLQVDQTPIGKTPRSCPATYIGFWDEIRRLYAHTSEARIRGYGPSRFSFNVKEGRCAACDGQGMQKVEMNFLPDVKVNCEVCHGARFNQETRAILYKDKSIADVLAMSVEEAVDFFSAHVKIHHALCLLRDVGLGYLTLGQQSPTLSGGEAQRIKLVSELAKTREPIGGRTSAQGNTLYILDEPTVGLHMADVEKLIRVLHRLVEAGHSVIVIEHNLDVIAEADWLIDVGPEGGAGGGHIVAEGTPEDVARQAKKSHTAKILKKFLKERG